MADGSTIEWTDATVNFWWGCTKVGPGCDHCYAETFDRRTGGAHWGLVKQKTVEALIYHGLVSLRDDGAFHHGET